MREECSRCVVYRSFPNHKGDCEDSCLLELDWNQIKKDLEEYNRIGEIHSYTESPSKKEA